MTRPLRLLALPLLLLLLAACGGSAKAPSGPTYKAETLDACILFPGYEAEAFAGEEVASMSSTLDDATNRRDPLVCSYNAGSLAEPRIVGLEVRASATPAAARSRFEGSKPFLRNLAAGEAQDVPGLGQGAYWVGGSLHQLHVLEGNLILVVTVQTANAAKSLYLCKQVAQRVLNRLHGIPPGTRRRRPRPGS
jgi:hypothetical protein